MAIKEYNPKERKSLAGAYSYTTEEIREAREAWERTYPAMAEYRDRLAAKVRELTRPVQPFTIDIRGFRIHSVRATVFRRPSQRSQGLRTEDFVGQAEAMPGVTLEWVCLVVLSVEDPRDGRLELTMAETHPYHPDDLTDSGRRKLRKWAEYVTQKVILHELAECLRIDGELATDPHPEVDGHRKRREDALRRHYAPRATMEFVIDDPEETIRQFTGFPEDHVAEAVANRCQECGGILVHRPGCKKRVTRDE